MFEERDVVTKTLTVSVTINALQVLPICKMKNKKGTGNVSDLKRKIKVLQDQVTSQGDMINAMAVQIAELVSDRKTKEAKKANLTDSSTELVSTEDIFNIIRRIDNDLKEVKEQNLDCKNINKRIDELGALCAAAMVAAGTKLNREVAERQAEQRNETNKLKDADTEAKHKGRDSGHGMSPEGRARHNSSEIPVDSSVLQTGTRSYASVVSEGSHDMALGRRQSVSAFVQKTTSAIQSNEHASDDDNYEEFTTVMKKRRNATKTHKKRSDKGAVLIGGANVYRISAAARNEFNLNRRMFRSVPGMLTEDVQRYVTAALHEAGDREMDVVLHVGSEDLASRRSVDFILEGIAGIIGETRKKGRVRDVFVCSVEERRDLGQAIQQDARCLNEQLSLLCSSYGAKFIDLRSRLQECRFGGINRTGILYTTEGGHNVSQVLLSEVSGFLD